MTFSQRYPRTAWAAKSMFWGGVGFFMLAELALGHWETTILIGVLLYLLERKQDRQKP